MEEMVITYTHEEAKFSEINYVLKLIISFLIESLVRKRPDRTVLQYEKDSQNRPPPPPIPKPPSSRLPKCPYCGKKVEYIWLYDKYYCKRCFLLLRKETVEKEAIQKHPKKYS